MREERGHLAGDLIINEPYTLWGSIAGVVTVAEGAKFYMRGAIYGDLNVEPGGRVHVYGNITGDVTLGPNTKAILSGTVGGDAVNRGGRLYIDAAANIIGRVKTIEGETTVEPASRGGKG